MVLVLVLFGKNKSRVSIAALRCSLILACEEMSLKLQELIWSGQWSDASNAIAVALYHCFCVCLRALPHPLCDMRFLVYGYID